MLIVDDVYEEILRNHALFSRNYLNKIAKANHSAKGANPACGDEIQINIRTDKNIIRDIGFHGNCCEIVKSSASLMTQELKTKTKDEAEILYLHVQDIVSSKTQHNEVFQMLIKQISLMPIGKKHHHSIRCALLPWEVMIKALHSKKNTSVSGAGEDYSLFLE